MTWFKYTASPTDFFAFALTAEDYAKAKLESRRESSKLIDLTNLSRKGLEEADGDGEGLDSFDLNAFQRIARSAALALNEFNTAEDWRSDLYFSPMPALNGGPDVTMVFWRKADNNGTVFIVSDQKLHDNELTDEKYNRVSPWR